MLVGKFKILLKMLRPERMTSTSIICVKKDVESILESLSSFGEFHIETSPQNEASLGEYNQSIQTVQERLLDVNGLTAQLVKEKTGLLDIFKVKEPTTVNVTADNWRSLLDSTSQSILGLKKEIESLTASLESLKEKSIELTHLCDMLATLHDMGVDLASISKFRLLHVEIARMPERNFEAFQVAISQLPLEVHKCPLVGDWVFVCVAMPAKHQEEVAKILHTYHAELFMLPSGLPNDAGEALKEVKAQLKENTEKQKELAGKLEKLGEENRGNLAAWKETSENVLMLLEAEKKILQSGRLATIKGFVPQNKFSDLKVAVYSKMNDKALVLPNGALETEEAPPTKIKHNRFVKPFEELTRLYGLPKYEEVDPTPFIAITFPILFGLMFGDLGHGLALLIGGLVVGSLIKGNQGMKNVCWIMAACGAGASVAGLLFGEFFGTELPWGPLWFSPFSPTNNVFDFLIFSLFVGIVQIVSGIIIEMVNYVMKHEYADAILTSVPKIGFYVGGVFLIATYQLDFAAWLAGPILAPVIPFVIMVIGKPLYLKAKPSAAHSNSEHAEQDTITGRLFEGGDFFTRLLSNTISYSRILALLMAHWALLLVVYQISGLVEGLGTLGLVLSVFVIVFGNIFVLALEGLIVFIHTLRLHFYEWFSKFYAGTGTEFKAFKQKFVYTKLTLKPKKD
jgi:V/A-type H+-transporting ATPase subunit I